MGVQTCYGFLAASLEMMLGLRGGAALSPAEQVGATLAEAKSSGRSALDTTIPVRRCLGIRAKIVLAAWPAWR